MVKSTGVAPNPRRGFQPRGGYAERRVSLTPGMRYTLETH